jgi:hypothetical protein
MRFPATTTWRATAAALAALALSTPSPARAEPAPIVAQAMAPETDGATPPETPPADDMPAPADQAEELPDRPIQFGERRRPDPFDVNADHEASRPPVSPAIHPEDEVITCMAGCGHAGTTTYRKRKEAARR